MSVWKQMGRTFVHGVHVVYDQDGDVHRARLEESVSDVGLTQAEARERLAAKLERVAADLRRR